MIDRDAAGFAAWVGFGKGSSSVEVAGDLSLARAALVVGIFCRAGSRMSAMNFRSSSTCRRVVGRCNTRTMLLDDWSSGNALANSCAAAAAWRVSGRKANSCPGQSHPLGGSPPGHSQQDAPGSNSNARAANGLARIEDHGTTSVPPTSGGPRASRAPRKRPPQLLLIVRRYCLRVSATTLPEVLGHRPRSGSGRTVSSTCLPFSSVRTEHAVVKALPRGVVEVLTVVGHHRRRGTVTCVIDLSFLEAGRLCAA